MRNKTWRSEFAGKEILRDIGSRICDQGRFNRRMNRMEFDINLAKDVADWQMRNNAVPGDISALLKAINARIERASGNP